MAAVREWHSTFDDMGLYSDDALARQGELEAAAERITLMTEETGQAILGELRILNARLAPLAQVNLSSPFMRAILRKG